MLAGEYLPEHNGDVAAAPDSRNAQQRAANAAAGVQQQSLRADSSTAEAVANTVFSPHSCALNSFQINENQLY